MIPLPCIINMKCDLIKQFPIGQSLWRCVHVLTLGIAFGSPKHLPPELATMLARAASNIRLEWYPPPCPECSQLDYWYLGSEHDSQPHPAPVSFFPEVHGELRKSWRAPFTFYRVRFTGSSTLTTLDGETTREYTEVPQVEHVIAVHLCLQNTTSWHNRPTLPSRTCKKA